MSKPAAPLKKDDASDSLLLTSNEGKQVELTTAMLDRWFASLERPKTAAPTSMSPDSGTPQTDTYLATQFLSRYGLKSSKDVIIFLKSPAGKATEAMIEAELKTLIALRDEQNFQQREHEALRHRIMAFFLLGFIYSEEAKAENLHHVMQKEIDKLLANDHKPANSTQSGIKASAQAAADAYDNISTALEDRLNEKLVESSSLQAEIDAELAAAEEHSKFITEKYQSLEAGLAQLAEAFSAAGKEHIENKISTLKEQLHDDAHEIGKLLESENPEDHLLAREKLHASNIKNLQIASLKDMLSVVNGDSSLYKLNGDRAATFDEADLILAKDKQIIKDGEKYYLLPAGKNVKDLSLEDKSHAEKAYEHIKTQPAMLSVKKLIGHNRNLEHGEHNERKSALNDRSETMQRDIDVLAKQLTLVQAARAHAQAMIPQAQARPTPPNMTPLPTSPSPNGSMPSARASNTPVATPTPSFLTSAYRHMLLLMRNSPTEDALARLRQGMAHNPEALKTLDRLKAGTPIPEQTMRSLLANIERFGVDARKPNVAPPLRPTSALQPTPEHQPTPSFNPSPFSTKPKGF